ncbi:hypothetical protein [Acinetobacter sp. MB5]|uniref:hypothetical protein n=1 Tax=Acinetobacter sp. MB5 TaxID=2069438 RepID=UPI000DD0825B|nr:hypothetical protein [Acinetobacter sp. MB5]
MKLKKRQIGYSVILIMIVLTLIQCHQPNVSIKSKINNNYLIFQIFPKNINIDMYEIQDLENKAYPQYLILDSSQLLNNPKQVILGAHIQKYLKMHHAYFLSISLLGYGDRAPRTVNSQGFCWIQDQWLIPAKYEDETSFIERCHRVKTRKIT